MERTLNKMLTNFNDLFFLEHIQTKKPIEIEIIVYVTMTRL